MTGHNEFPTEVINCQSIKIGDGANPDDTVLLKFDIDRPWQFRQEGTGAGTRLELAEAGENNKIFRITGFSGTGAIIDFQPAASTDANPAVKITDAKDSNTGYALDIDRDGNSASRVIAVRIVCDNAGAGNVVGIDMSSFAAGEPLIKTPASAITNPGTLSHQIPIDIGGTIFYLYAYTAGS